MLRYRWLTVFNYSEAAGAVRLVKQTAKYILDMNRGNNYI
ncbi:hypothetical protein SAMN04487934_10922 [Eubacterium ruminantium]|nr:hypothetical protein SAMN04487934_10922 [Eubacterium ruminantium]